MTRFPSHSVAARAIATMAGVFLALDAAWLGLMAERLYRPAIGPLLAETVDLAAAAAFYALYLAGVAGLAVMPALASGRWRGAAARGALLGLVAYGTYDLTNQATLRGWPWHVTFADLAWGTLATALAAGAGAWAGLRRRR